MLNTLRTLSARLGLRSPAPAPTPLMWVESYRGCDMGWVSLGFNPQPLEKAERMARLASQVHPAFKWRISPHREMTPREIWDAQTRAFERNPWD